MMFLLGKHLFAKLDHRLIFRLENLKLKHTSNYKTYTLPNSGSDTRLVFRSSVVDGKIINLESNLAFKAQELTITKNNSPLTGNNTASVANLSSEDYIFSSNTALANTHTVTFRNLLSKAGIFRLAKTQSRYRHRT